jgi:hypothetical protein
MPGIGGDCAKVLDLTRNRHRRSRADSDAVPSFDFDISVDSHRSLVDEMVKSNDGVREAGVISTSIESGSARGEPGGHVVTDSLAVRRELKWAVEVRTNVPLHGALCELLAQANSLHLRGQGQGSNDHRRG